MIRPAGCHGVKAMPKVRLIPSDIRMLLAHYGNPLPFSTFRKCCRIHLIFLKSIPYSFLSPSYPLVFPNILPKIGVNFGSTHLLILKSLDYIIGSNIYIPS